MQRSPTAGPDPGADADVHADDGFPMPSCRALGGVLHVHTLESQHTRGRVNADNSFLMPSCRALGGVESRHTRGSSFGVNSPFGFFDTDLMCTRTSAYDDVPGMRNMITGSDILLTSLCTVLLNVSSTSWPGALYWKMRVRLCLFRHLRSLHWAILSCSCLLGGTEYRRQ